MPIKLFLQRPWGRQQSSCAALLLCCAFAAGANAAPKDAQPEIAKFMQRGQLEEALKQIDEALAARPADPKLRFSKGTILAQQGKSTEAIAILLKLTEDYPSLSEPYNNLGVLYAADKQYEKARIVLNQAVVNRPDYGMAYENLGDVHAALASQAYEKASRLDGAASARSKATALRASDSTGARKAETGQSVSGPDTSEAQSAVLAAVTAWAKAWSARDMKAYLAAYSNDFVTPGGMSHEAWVAERTRRIVGKQHISVTVEAPKVTVKGARATVQFQQQFLSDQMRSKGRKTLHLVQRDGSWRIREERV